jgi:hypothetical protein
LRDIFQDELKINESMRVPIFERKWDYTIENDKKKQIIF